MLIWLSAGVFAQSPHGEDLKIDCGECHNPNGWIIDYNQFSFDHDQTEFALEGIHELTDCKLCHPSLVFDQAPADCFACHQDVHNMTVGNDCARCHDPQSWLVDDIPELHEQNGFPLMGTHASLSCVECHASETNLVFERIGNECVNCHRNDFANTQNPDHEASGFSLECDQCHNPFGFDWNTEIINHDFFPLEQGHDIQDCSQCHDITNFSDVTSDCFACHQTEFAATTDPNHQQQGFPTDCALCHSLAPDWTPASFQDHDAQYFPIYSGKHQGTWNDCTECHNDPNNFAVFTCFTCHLKPETDNDHDEVTDYVYESQACLQCHPTGGD